ncbi:hypothetical protein PybrP1_010838 [[Pythium] brassicae (nom. inval.)]|nr:hypothetical protein PybrP1_010838 [[Pythium] brassicae (nom. inval.)]
MDSLLSKLYNDPKTGFSSAKNLYDRAKRVDKTIALRQVKMWMNDQVELQRLQQHKKKKYDDFKITSTNPDSWQMDLTFWTPTIILSAVNINSRLGYARILPNKSASIVLSGIKKFVTIHKPQVITTDNGSEFMNDMVQSYFKLKNITHYNNEAGDHTTMGKIERFNRTLKERLLRLNRKTTQKLLSDTIENYNNTYHTSINATPNEMRGEVIHEELNHNKELQNKVESDFTVGETVLLRLPKKQFQKGAREWSQTVYKIAGFDGYKIDLKTSDNKVKYAKTNDLKRTKAKQTKAISERRGPSGPSGATDTNTWEAERILQHKTLKNGKNKYLVKWKSHDELTWEPQNNLRLINKNKQSLLEEIYFDTIG